MGLSFSVPIFDWGLGKGKVQKARAAQEVVRAQVQQSENDTARQKYITDVSNFWEYYFTLRQYTLYDFVKGEDLKIDVNEMIH